MSELSAPKETPETAAAAAPSAWQALKKLGSRLGDWYGIQPLAVRLLVITVALLIPLTGLYSFNRWQKHVAVAEQVKAMAHAGAGGERLWTLDDKLPVVFGTGSVLGFVEGHPVDRITVVYKPLMWNVSERIILIESQGKQFAYYPVALLRSVPTFSNGTISVKFKTVAGDADRASGILFNVKPNGDWLAIRYNDTENNVALWEFHNGMRRPVKFSDRAKPFMLDRASYHELKMTLDGAKFTAWVDGVEALDYTLGSEPGPGRNGAAPHPDLFPANNPVLRPPVSGGIGLWAKTDSTSSPTTTPARHRPVNRYPSSTRASLPRK